MKHSVVIGGAGFVGSWVVDEILKDASACVTIVDNLLSSESWNISKNERVNFIKGSASKIETLKKISNTVDFVYQLACFHGNQSSIARPLDDLENGLKTTLVTLEWVKQYHPNAKVIYSGAGCAVAEKTWEAPTAVSEIDYASLKHDSPYSITKITGEMYALYYANQQNLDVVRVRFQNVYGPREILGAGKWRGTINTIWRNVIPTLIWKAINNQDLIVNTKASRDFIFVSDVAQAVILAAKLGQKSDVYNIGTGIEVSISTLAKKIISLTNSNSKIILSENRSWDNSGRRMANTTKTTNNLGFTYKTEIEDGLKATIDWNNSNYKKIEKSINRYEE
jgi:UDP-glucose 4-epimerase